ncbi:type II secretion system F family protein [Paraburkholderia youngii]|uniref:type II secretion system F family protein n=1 Tax=Paraburkholderia youngii TaxID=2782701 RepID=UPI003D1A9156
MKLGLTLGREATPSVSNAHQERPKSMAVSWGNRRKFYEQAANQLENGRGLTEILLNFKERMERRGRKKTAAVFQEILNRVRDGDTLSVAMGQSLNELERDVLAASDKSGQVAKSMRLILDVRERTTRMRRAIQSSLFAPAVYATALYAVLAVIGLKLVPEFVDTLPISKWTGWAYVLYVMGSFATSWVGPFVVALLLVLIIAGWSAAPRWTGEKIPGRKFCDNYVIGFTEYKELRGFGWLMAYTALLQTGISDTEALASQIAVASPWLASRLEPIRAGLKNGLKLDAAMRRSGFAFPSPDLIDEIGAYVDFTDFASKIETVALKYADDLERKIKWKGVLTGVVFSGLMFIAFVIVQLGANDISSILSSSVGTF